MHMTTEGVTMTTALLRGVTREKRMESFRDSEAANERFQAALKLVEEAGEGETLDAWVLLGLREAELKVADAVLQTALLQEELAHATPGPGTTGDRLESSLTQRIRAAKKGKKKTTKKRKKAKKKRKKAKKKVAAKPRAKKKRRKKKAR